MGHKDPCWVYTMYIKPIGSICIIHGLVHQFYADVSHLFLSFKPTDNVARTEAFGRVNWCLNDIVAGCMTKMLKRIKLKLLSSHLNAMQSLLKRVSDYWWMKHKNIMCNKSWRILWLEIQHGEKSISAFAQFVKSIVSENI